MSPLVVFIVPGEGAQQYAAAMQQLTINALEHLNRSFDDIDVVGLISASPAHGAEGIYFLEEMGIDSRNIVLLVLWGEAAECLNFEEEVSPECGVGFVALPKTGVVLPAVRMPPIDGDWWYYTGNQSYATETYASLISNGRARPDGSEHMVFIANPAIWN